MIPGLADIETNRRNHALAVSMDAQPMRLQGNPVAENLQISFNNDITGQVIIKIIDINGKLVKTFSSEKNTDILQLTLAIEGIKPGVYNTEILINNQIYKSSKLIINQ